MDVDELLGERSTELQLEMKMLISGAEALFKDYEDKIVALEKRMWYAKDDLDYRELEALKREMNALLGLEGSDNRFA